ncbi:hypothetical protein [Pseudovibrio sp. POLY-S9]|uniref:hypothetical protein n=1 Tax=Pseudovibrio sp. POLY-S9 TaxID=1576596 RepID=UPI00070AE50F|nr:hypothetical protein [Pseudovibrio sp. POLY-S9]
MSEIVEQENLFDQYLNNLSGQEPDKSLWQPVKVSKARMALVAFKNLPVFKDVLIAAEPYDPDSKKEADKALETLAKTDSTESWKDLSEGALSVLLTQFEQWNSKIIKPSFTHNPELINSAPPAMSHQQEQVALLLALYTYFEREAAQSDSDHRS